ncbi:Guanine nucleotide-binding-like protein 1 [Mortierella alpina]|uniref:Guanine nucleotide-binding protein-like 1 n=1 Tax=Mortierella alpina TaxID=64518 RepID=A0A9P6JB41_MORAP|nr:Guanine nucleotide-binding-like protein 1 [Mortierella alpina]
MPRAKPFSGALKKKQLQERRARHNTKIEEQQQHERKDHFQNENPGAPSNSNAGTASLNAYNGRFVKSFSKEFKPESHDRTGTRENSNHPAGQKLRSVFMRRSPADIEKSRLASMKPLELLPESELEVSFEDMFPNVIGFPRRPKWDYSMSRQELERNETKMFEEWMDSVYNQYPAEELSYFEHNLEVWRQLWRVLEISDIIMIIVDIRHPVIHFPPSLYQYVVNDMKRKLVVVFNKVDLVAPNTLFAWKQYFKEQFPELHIAAFSCYPPDPALINDSSTAALQKVVKKPRRRFYNAVGVKDVLEACKDVELSKNGAQVDWDTLVSQYDSNKDTEFQESEDENGHDQNHDKEESLDQTKGRNLHEKESDSNIAATLQTITIEDEENTPHKDYVTIGLVGHPNVGKSSLINSIMGRTVVSTSRTPGHTKHFQTIHLTHNVRLCDSPGLVFPSLLPKPLQILSGMYPIAQVQEPYSVVQYLAMRVNVPRLLKLDPPPSYERGPFRWSAFAICESFAIQRGFLTAKTGHPDVYRAANAILRLTTDGRILLSFKPPGFFTSTKYEKLRIAEADAVVTSEEDGQEGGAAAGARATKGTSHDEEDEEDSEEESESEAVDSGDDDDEDDSTEEPVGAKTKSGKFQMNTRVGGFFGLLQDDEQDEQEEEEEVGSEEEDVDGPR